MYRLVLWLLVGVPAVLMAQPSAQVIRAEWGAGQTWRDVTQRVQGIIESGRPNFRVDAGGLGTDPLPGTPKTLRVRVRGRNGQVQTFEYRDLDIVELRSWGVSGDRGMAPIARDPRSGYGQGGLRVLSASYGDGRRQNDVTATLNNTIQGNSLSILVANQNLGGDPAPAALKRLDVTYQWLGQTYNVTIPENGWLRLPDATGSSAGDFNPGELRIVQATYGEGARQMDVTARLQSMVQNDRLSFRANNDSMGGDPARGADKRLTVIYDWQGQRYQANVDEDNTITLPRAGDQVVGAAQVREFSGDGVCFYRQAYFQGEAACVRAGQEMPNLAHDGNARFLSVRFFGNVRQVQVWNQPNFNGRPARLQREDPNLSGPMTAIYSVRVN
ncbi:MAG: DUF3395 domain-containing protein [Acidobacteriia bacterium]|nr:DUF3395 domain-containing protein [Terriglobia bacterium]